MTIDPAAALSHVDATVWRALSGYARRAALRAAFPGAAITAGDLAAVDRVAFGQTTGGLLAGVAGAAAFLGAAYALQRPDALRSNPDTGELIVDDPLTVEAAVAAWERDGIPGPTGLTRPHKRGASKCDPDNAVWEGYRAALEDASEHAAIVAADEGDAAAMDAFRDALAADPRFPKWREVADQCAAAFARGREKRGAVESTARTAQLERQRMLREGVDPGSAEYLDTLTPSGRAKALRRMGRGKEAREIERRMRGNPNGVPLPWELEEDAAAMGDDAASGTPGEDYAAAFARTARRQNALQHYEPVIKAAYAAMARATRGVVAAYDHRDKPGIYGRLAALAREWLAASFAKRVHRDATSWESLESMRSIQEARAVAIERYYAALAAFARTPRMQAAIAHRGFTLPADAERKGLATLENAAQLFETASWQAAGATGGIWQAHATAEDGLEKLEDGMLALGFKDGVFISDAPTTPVNRLSEKADEAERVVREGEPDTTTLESLEESEALGELNELGVAELARLRAEASR